MGRLRFNQAIIVWSGYFDQSCFTVKTQNTSLKPSQVCIYHSDSSIVQPLSDFARDITMVRGQLNPPGVARLYPSGFMVGIMWMRVWFTMAVMNALLP